MSSFLWAINYGKRCGRVVFGDTNAKSARPGIALSTKAHFSFVAVFARSLFAAVWSALVPYNSEFNARNLPFSPLTPSAVLSS